MNQYIYVPAQLLTAAFKSHILTYLYMNNCEISRKKLAYTFFSTGAGAATAALPAEDAMESG